MAFQAEITKLRKVSLFFHRYIIPATKALIAVITIPIGPVINLMAKPNPRVAIAAIFVAIEYLPVIMVANEVFLAFNICANARARVTPVQIAIEVFVTFTIALYAPVTNEAPPTTVLYTPHIGRIAASAPPTAVKIPVISPIVLLAVAPLAIKPVNAVVILNITAPTGAIPLINPTIMDPIFLSNCHTIGPFVSKYFKKFLKPSVFFKFAAQSLNDCVTPCMPTSTLCE